MRIIGFSKKWPKLEQEQFSTFRFARRDRDWQVGEVAQVVYKPRSKEREILGEAQIVDKYSIRIFPEPIPDPICPIGSITERDAIEDGFASIKAMQLWMWDTHKRRVILEPMNKLTLTWKERRHYA